MNDKMYFYERFADEFDSKMNMYDTNKRLHVIYNELLTEDISGSKLLDAGCGTGWFSKWACDRNAKVVSMDLGEGLLGKVATKCDSQRIVGSILNIPFEEDTFDFVVSSEVIEHTPDPRKAIAELYRVLKPGGILILSVPNKFWYFSIWLANKLNLRPYDGYENWLGWFELKSCLKNNNFQIERMQGIHLFPFVFGFTYPILDFFHKFNKPLGPVMLNIAVRCQKPQNDKV